jgi:hypothetical protein
MQRATQTNKKPTNSVTTVISFVRSAYREEPTMADVIPVLLSDPEATLRSIVFASRSGLATAYTVDDCFPQQAAKIAIDRDAIREGDYVVRSVIAGSRRKLEILAADENGVGFRHLMETLNQMTPPAERKFACQSRVEFNDGHTHIELPGAIVIAAYKGR